MPETVGPPLLWPTGRCGHRPPCPAADAADRSAAVALTRDYVTAWALLCNQVIHFDDGGDLLPSGECIAPASRSAA
ncbi:DUF5999 family protein [Streptomyces tsukubensis]|uniref:DUF5999 family protein n=1 Tax=Streptomyces tsukubensis TaxID=83656 RepID=UPI00344DC9EC